jgi:hypothetical protein
MTAKETERQTQSISYASQPQILRAIWHRRVVLVFSGTRDQGTLLCHLVEVV